MKKLAMTVMLTLLLGAYDVAQTGNTGGNRVVAIVGLVVNRGDGSPVPDALVALLRLENQYYDHTNKDGLYCVYIPRETGEFTLVSKAPGYWSGSAKNQNSNEGRIKMDRLYLEKQKPNDRSQLERLGPILDTQYKIYQASTSSDLRARIKNDLNDYRQAIEIPPPPPPGMFDSERLLKLNARAQVENLLFKLK